MEIIEIQMAYPGTDLQVAALAVDLHTTELGILRTVAALLAYYHIRGGGVPAHELSVLKRLMYLSVLLVPAQIRKEILAVHKQLVPPEGKFGSVCGVMVHIAHLGLHETPAVGPALRECPEKGDPVLLSAGVRSAPAGITAYMQRNIIVIYNRNRHPAGKSVTVAASVAFLLNQVHLLSEDTAGDPPVLAPPGHRHSQTASAGKGIHYHRTLIGHDIARAGHPLHTHRLLEMTGLNGKMLAELIPEIHVLYLYFIVGEIQVKLGEPPVVKLGLDGESGPAYTHPVAETEHSVVLLQVLIDLGHKSVHRLRREIERCICVDTVVQPQMELAVPGPDVELAVLEIHTCF